MKKPLILTSILALAVAACSGGGGEHNPGHTHGPAGTPTGPAAPTTPNITLPGFSGGTTVNAQNSGLTNMASYSVDYTHGANTSKGLMVAYVNSHLGGALSVMSTGPDQTRAATSQRATRNRDFTDEQFAVADAAITQMKQVIYDMVNNTDNDEALTAYVTQYQGSVAQALKLAGEEISDDASVEDLITKFHAYETANSLTANNVMAYWDTFDQGQFEITKHSMETDVKLRDTGTDAYFKFKLDDTGKIETVSLWESPTADYGTSWANKRIIINGSGVAEAVAPGALGLNPFDSEYLNSAAGDLVRNGNSFTNTLTHYEFHLGNYAGGGDVIAANDFDKIEIDNLGDVGLDDAKTKLKDYLIKKINNKLHGQHGGYEAPDDLAIMVAAVNHYIGVIDALTADDVTAARVGTFTQTVNMDGVGKDVGLKYSDFGYATKVADMGGDQETEYLTYVGGYDSRRMDNSVVHNDLNGATFTGTAVITVEDEHEDKNVANHAADYKHTALYKDTTAQLQYSVTVDKATHTLTMNNLKAVEGDNVTEGSDWYTTVISGTEDNPTMTASFNGAGKTIDDNYKFFEVNDGVVTRAQGVVDTTGGANAIDMQNGTPGAGGYADNYRMHGNASAEYYGQDKVTISANDEIDPTEATAGFHVSERYHSNDNNVQHELSVYGAFGGQKD